jgi:KaiC/GvpD/RAD55 family RecA-like ATPase
MQRISTGIEGLDKMLRGGLIPGRPYVLTGPPGSGKSILGVHFLLAGIQAGESTLLVAVDEPPNEIKANMAHFGWNLDRLRILDATPDIRAHSKSKSIVDVGTTLDVRDMEQVSEMRKSQHLRIMEVSVHSVQKMLKQEFQDHLYQTGKRYSRIVVDSFTALKMFSMKQDANILVQSFLRFLSELEATTIITSDLPSPTDLMPRFFLCRGDMRLHKWVDEGRTRRAISIEKFRGSAFDDRYRPMEITSAGMVVDADGIVDLRGKHVDLTPSAYIQELMAEEAFEVIEEALAAIEEAKKRVIDTSDAQALLMRATLLFQLRRYDEMLKAAMKALDLVRTRLQAKPAIQVKLGRS